MTPLKPGVKREHISSTHRQVRDAFRAWQERRGEPTKPPPYNRWGKHRQRETKP